jgi:hypothetical protein
MSHTYQLPSKHKYKRPTNVANYLSPHCSSKFGCAITLIPCHCDPTAPPAHINLTRLKINHTIRISSVFARHSTMSSTSSSTHSSMSSNTRSSISSWHEHKQGSCPVTGKGYDFCPAQIGDARSPCPALNALANHGYL